MKFYDRIDELNILAKNTRQSRSSAFFTTMMGRRRVGKTALLMQLAPKEALVYFYISKDSEQMLCQRLQAVAVESLGLPVYGQTQHFGELFELLMAYSREHPFTLIIDEFQNLLSVNAAIPSHIQDVWDRYRDKSRVHLVACGSIYSMMHRIFDHGDAPLYGRRDSNLRILPFSTAVLKEILRDHNPDYTPEDLLCLYMLTGGVAKYVALLMDAKAVSQRKMLNYATAADSPFLTEGTELLVSEFGRDYGTYFSILQLIAGGMTSQSQIDSVIGKNTGAYLNNLSEDYTFVKKALPIFAKPGTRNCRWYIDDCFLRFWFSFVYPCQGLIESGRLDLLRKHIESRYAQFSGLTLEHYFRQKAMEEGDFTEVGAWWDRKGVNELDLVAVNTFDRSCTIAEVKRNEDKIDPALLATKADAFSAALPQGYRLKTALLSMKDM